MIRYEDSDEFDDELGEVNEDDAGDPLEAEIRGSLDGESDAHLHLSRYASYGMGLGDLGRDESDLTDEERDAYMQGYESGYDLARDFTRDEDNACWD